MNTLVILALAMVGGLAMSRVVKKLNMPNVTGYLVAGLLIGPCVLHLIPRESLDSLTLVTDVALGFIAFSIGGEFKLSFLKRVGAAPIVITLFEGLTALVLVDIILLILGFDTPLVLMLGAIATATAPAATLMVVRQYKAKGPVTEMLLPVVAMDDALCLMSFSICSAIAKTMVSGSALTVGNMLLEPLKEIGLSLAIGLALGFLMSLALRFFHSRANFLCLVVLVVFLGVGLSNMMGLSSLLVCMMVGATTVNLSKKADNCLKVCDNFTPPLFMLFFAISGAELDLTVLPTVGVLGVTYILVRVAGKWLGASLGSKIMKQPPAVNRFLGATLMPQAGVAIGMATLAMSQVPAYGPQIRTVILCGTLIYELIGPLVTKFALTRAGEIHVARKDKPAAAPPLSS